MDDEGMDQVLEELSDQISETADLEKNPSEGVVMMLIRAINWVITGIAWIIIAFIFGTVGITYWK